MSGVNELASWRLSHAESSRWTQIESAIVKTNRGRGDAGSTTAFDANGLKILLLKVASSALHHCQPPKRTDASTTAVPTIARRAFARVSGVGGVPGGSVPSLTAAPIMVTSPANSSAPTIERAVP